MPQRIIRYVKERLSDLRPSPFVVIDRVTLGPGPFLATSGQVCLFWAQI